MPVTTTGHVVAVLLMIGGIALIGVLAGSLAEFLRTGDKAEKAGTATTAADANPARRGRPCTGPRRAGARERRGLGRGPGAASRARRAPVLTGERLQPARAVIRG